MLLRNVARVALIGAALIAAAASASSKQQTPPPGGPAAPAPQQMDPSQALGLWKTNFGAVKIETNTAGGPGAVHGVWVYTRESDGQEVIGYFGGTLSGNVLQFTWQEPGENGAPLVGAGYLVFDAYGQKFDGQWWTSTRDRNGEWSGARAPTSAPAGPAYGGSVYGQY